MSSKLRKAIEPLIKPIPKDTLYAPFYQLYASLVAVDLRHSLGCFPAVVWVGDAYSVIDKSLQYGNTTLLSGTVCWGPATCHAHASVCTVLQQFLCAFHVTCEETVDSEVSMDHR